MTKGWCAVLSLAVLAGCSNSLNTNCGWDPEPSRQLNLSTPTDARHLHQVVELAEELSIRFGDERWAPGPSRAQGREEQCFTPLLQQVADRHGIALADVLAARGRLGDRSLNLAVNIPAAAFFVAITVALLRRIYTRFSLRDERVAVLATLALSAFLVGGLTAGFGRLWEVVFETIRLGNGHLSYRGLRLPWTQHAFAFAALATGAFAIIALVHHVTMTIRGRGTGTSTSTFGTYP